MLRRVSRLSRGVGVDIVTSPLCAERCCKLRSVARVSTVALSGEVRVERRVGNAVQDESVRVIAAADAMAKALASAPVCWLGVRAGGAAPMSAAAAARRKGPSAGLRRRCVSSSARLRTRLPCVRMSHDLASSGCTSSRFSATAWFTAFVDPHAPSQR